MSKARWHPTGGEIWQLLSAGCPIAEVRRDDEQGHPGRAEEEWCWTLIEPAISGRAALLSDAQSCAWRAAKDALHPAYFE